MKGLRRKAWTGPKIWSPKLRYFVTILWFVANHALFGNLWRKKCFLGSNTVFFGQEVHYYMVYIACCTELNWQFCNYAAKRCICRENSKYAFDEKFYGHFCPHWKAAIFCHPRQKQNNIPVLVNVFWVILHFGGTYYWFFHQ